MFFKRAFGGFFVGIVNGMFGAGGGMIAVPALKSTGIKGKKAHSSSVAVILPLSIATLIMYITDSRVTFLDGAPYILPGLLGALIGTLALSKISYIWLRRIFGALMVYAGIRLILK